MKEELLTINNFWRHPRFWRHAIAWMVGIGYNIFQQIYFNLYPNEPLQETLFAIILSIIMIQVTAYSSIYFYEKYYKREKRFLFFLLHVPLFILITSISRGVAYLAGIPYNTSIWSEISGVPIILIAIYSVKFIYHGIVDRIAFNQLQLQHTKTEQHLLNTKIAPQLLIKELQNIHATNLKDTDQANDAILELADDLRQRLDQSGFSIAVAPPNFQPTFTTSSTNKSANKKLARLKRHLLVWILFTLLLLLNVWGQSGQSWAIWNDYLPVRLLLLWLYALVIYPSIFLYNRLIRQKKYSQYLLLQVLFFISAAFILSIIRTKTNVFFDIGKPISFQLSLIGTAMVLLAAFSIKMAYHLINERQALISLKTKQTETELKLLKSQINPHFLFNVLNNIYAKNLEDSQKANEYLAGLTSILSYQSESQRQAYIALKEEVQIVKNYIELEAIRLHNCEVQVEEKGDFATFTIIPLLLLPLVENAFKYGSGIEKGHIFIYFEQSGKQFTFICKNKIIGDNTRKPSTGIGLDNVRKRLAIKYKNNYTFKTKIVDHTFIATLNITL